MTKEYIAESMTIQQMGLFYENILRLKVRYARFDAAVLCRVINAAVAGKKEAIDELMKQLDEDFVNDVNKQIDEARKMGLPIEDK